METTLAMLLALGIFIGIPAVIGFAIVGTLALRERIRMAHKAKVGQVETKVARSGGVVR